MEGTQRRILRQVEIADYPDKILISNQRRALYYVSATSTHKGKKKIPQKYRNRDKFDFNEKGILVNKISKSPVVANSRSAGKPRYWVVNFQEIWNGAASGPARAAKANKLKDIFTPYLKTIRPLQTREYPIRVEIFLYDTEFPVDASNKGVIYHKIIEDIMVREGVIIDDSESYINDAGRTKLIRCSSKSEKRMIIRLVQSDNLAY